MGFRAKEVGDFCYSVIWGWGENLQYVGIELFIDNKKRYGLCYTDSLTVRRVLRVWDML